MIQTFFKKVSFLFLITTLFSASAFSMELKSDAFKMNDDIPQKYTCDGDDISPPLAWSDLPDGTKSLALITDDPDAPMGTWVHWVIYNLQPDLSGLEENIPKTDRLQNGALQGVTDFRRVGYGGPCPPPGKPHRYYFKLYALDQILDLPPKATKDQLLKEIQNHVLANTEFVGLYGRGRK